MKQVITFNLIFFISWINRNDVSSDASKDFFSNCCIVYQIEPVMEFFVALQFFLTNFLSFYGHINYIPKRNWKQLLQEQIRRKRDCKVFLRIPNISVTIFISCLNNQLSRVLSLKPKKRRKRSSRNVMFDSLIKFCYVDEEASTVGVYCINIT